MENQDGEYNLDLHETYDLLLKEIFTEMVFQVEIEHHFEQSIKSDLEKLIKEDRYPLNYHDIFNNANSKDANECVCPNCSRTLGAIRFAPHLEKCVGMGRSSSRIASRRILASSNSGKELRYNEDISDGNSGSQGNGDWVPVKSVKRTSSKRRRDRNGKNIRNRKKIEDVISVSDDSDDIRYSCMNHEQKQHILAHMCGVVSEHTGKLCTRSIRCPKHSDEQRNNVRLAVLSSDNIEIDFGDLIDNGKIAGETDPLAADQDSDKWVK